MSGKKDNKHHPLRKSSTGHVSKNTPSFSVSFLYIDDGKQEIIPVIRDILNRSHADCTRKSEFIIADIRGTSPESKSYLSDPVLSGLIEKGTIKTIDLPGETSPVRAVQAMIEKCSGDFICLPDSTLQRGSFMLNEIFSLPVDKNVRHHALQLFFSHKEKKRNHADSLLLIPVQAGKYIFSKLMPSVRCFPAEVMYHIRGLKIPMLQYTLNQTVSSEQGNCHIPFFQRGIDRLRHFVFFIYNWYVRIPLKELKNPEWKNYSFVRESPLYRLFFFIILLGLFFLLPCLSIDAGISADELPHYQQAEKVFNYYATFGKDRSALEMTRIDPMHYHGQLFDNITFIINKLFHAEDIFTLRHILNSFTGWLIILFSGLIAVYISGWRAGLFVVLLLAVSPRLIGHSLNNNKDIPFALGYIFTLYQMMRMIRQLPAPSVSSLSGVAGGIALTISIRIGGVVLIPYLLVFITAWYIVFFSKNIFSVRHLKIVRKIFFYWLILSVGGFLAGILFWPYGLEAPVRHSIEVLKATGNFPVKLRLLFEGKMYWSDNLPWYYNFKFIWISVPIAVLSGLFMFSGLIGKIMKRKNNIHNLYIGMILFAFLFPLFFMGLKTTSNYGGWRHFIFVYPPMVIASSLGFEACMRVLKKYKLKFTVMAFLLLLCALPVRSMIRIHPYEYIYFNELVGGTKKAYGHYETDYFFHSIKEASLWLANHINTDTLSPGRKIIVVSNISNITDYCLRHYRDKITVIYSKYYSRGMKNWDYGIFNGAYTHYFHLQNRYWPPKNTIHTVTAGDVPVCAIIERKDKSDYLATQALERNENEKAVDLLKKAIEHDPLNEVAWLTLSKAYTGMKQFDKASFAALQCLKVYPDYEIAYNYLGAIKIYQNDYSSAMNYFDKAISINPYFVDPYNNMAVMLQDMGNNRTALMYLMKCIQYNPKFKMGYLNLARLLEQIGDTERASYFLNIAKAL